MAVGARDPLLREQQLSYSFLHRLKARVICSVGPWTDKNRLCAASYWHCIKNDLNEGDDEKLRFMYFY